MTQPAKSQEPSMEEILASIRRIIADDDANKTPSKGPEPMTAEAPPAAVPPMPSAPSDSSRPRGEPDARAAMQPLNPPEPASVADQSSDILDLTESMAAMPQPSPAAQAASVMSNPQFRTIDGSSDVGFDEESERPAAPGPAPRWRGAGRL